MGKGEQLPLHRNVVLLLLLLLKDLYSALGRIKRESERCKVFCTLGLVVMVKRSVDQSLMHYFDNLS